MPDARSEPTTAEIPDRIGLLAPSIIDSVVVKGQLGKPSASLDLDQTLITLAIGEGDPPGHFSPRGRFRLSD